MKKICALLVVAVACLVALGSCAQATDSTPAIVGTWTLSTVQGAPASNAFMSGSIVVASAMTYTSTITAIFGAGTTSGTVKDNGGYSFTFTPDTVGAAPFDATLSSDGKTLSHTDGFWGTLVYTK